MANAAHSFALCIAAFIAGPANAAKASVSPVQKVIMLIDEMAAKVTKEAAEESRAFEEYAKFCDDEATAKEYAIKDSLEAIEEFEATIADAKATIETEDSKVGDLSTKISDTEAELSTAVSLRSKEHDEFVKTEKELVETVQELAGAQTAIQKSMSFAQGGKVSVEDGEVLNTVIQGLGQIIQASFVSPRQKDRIAALLQEHADAQEDAEDGSRAMAVDAILQTLKEMEDKAEASLTEVRKGESEAQMNGSLLKQGLENEIKTMKQEMAESTSKSASTAQALAQAEKDLAVEKKGKSDDEAYLRDLKRDCQARAGDFEVEAKDNAAELKALGSAKAILEKKFASFVQTGSKTRARVAARDEGDSSKLMALRSIEQLGKRLHSTALVALAYRAAEDPFGKVRGMIEEMIAKLLQEAAEEATQKAFCDKEIGESKTAKADKEGKLDKVNARIEKSDSASATLTQDISKLSAEVAENDKAMADATAIRQKEKADFMVVEKDLSESQEACAAAIEVLREYYEGASLLQVSAKAHMKARSVETVESEGDGSGILGVLEVAESDFAEGLAEARTIEQESQNEYDKVMQDGKMLKMTKEMEIKGKQSELKGIKTTLTDLNEDKTGLNGELDAVLAYLDKLKPQCEVKVPSYAERKAARDQEIEGLKNALDILEEGAPALVQTGSQLHRA